MADDGDDDRGDPGPAAEDEKRRQREEKRLARQKEIEAKRAARKGGAMKLGSKMT